MFTQVLFPLLDSVKKLSGQASDEKVDTSGSILIHHSRNTAQKQWAETQVRYPCYPMDHVKEGLTHSLLLLAGLESVWCGQGLSDET